MCQISSWSVYSVALEWRNTPNFAIFSTSAFCGVAIWQPTEKVERGCTLHNYKPSPIQRYQNCFCTPTLSRRNHALKFRRSQARRSQARRSQARRHKRDGQTDKKLMFFGHPGGGEIRAPPIVRGICPVAPWLISWYYPGQVPMSTTWAGVDAVVLAITFSPRHCVKT